MHKLTHYAVAELIQEHREELHGYLVRQTRCSEAASDILQDAFLRLIHSDIKNDLKNPRAFLYKIVSNLAIDHLRSSNRRVARHADESELAYQADPTPSIEHQLYTQEQIAHLRQAVSELPPRCREVFIMHKFKHQPYSVIMDELGISESTVLKHIVKAMEHCRRRMRELDSPVGHKVAE
ncbi:RNA polymerase sigma factor [Methylobacter sp. Wu8]|uniref:RNA polymerase sigma factor n=1 Tax=Methylobacter sp. Wu8 TaxID=3118457 RepID=UPI002F3496A9